MSHLLNPTQTETASKRELLAEQLRKAAEAESIPLSFAQQRLWFLDQLEPNSPLYNVPVVVRLSGRLNVPALRQALNTVVARHEILRTCFVSNEGSPSQVVAEEMPVDLEIHDFVALPENQREIRAQADVRAEVNRPFNLSAGPLVRATLLRLRPDEHWFILNFHHIVSDEWSLKICFQELTELYAAACEGTSPGMPELPIQYADYALWQRDLLEEFESQFAYWQKQLGGNFPVLELPADHPRPATPSFRGGNVSRELGARLGSAVQNLAARHGDTPFMVLLAAFKALLHRYSGQDDILVGSPVAGRNQLETERLIGFFVNTLILRTDLSGDPAFEEVLRRVRETTLGAQAHQDLPFEKLVEKLRPERTLSHMPFARVMFSLQNNFFSELRWPGVTLHFVDVESDTAKFDLTFTVQETARGFVAKAEYNRDQFEAETIDRLLRHFEVLLGAAVENPGLRLSELPLLTEAGRRQLLVDWNQTATEYPRTYCIHQLFETQAALTPNAIAVCYGDQSITYRELNERANQLAWRLKKLSVGPDVPVGICLGRSIEMMVGLLAILKAGGAYVPLDAAYPKERLAFMVADAQMPVLMTQQRLAARFPQKGVTIVCIDADGELIAGEKRGNVPNTATTPENLAYVMYTSGSTGQPKGVAVPHRAVVRLVRNTNYIQFRPTDRVAQVSNASFDAATFEIWGALLNGGRLVGISNEIVLSPKDFAHALREQEISVMFLTCALFNQLAAEAPGAFGHMRVVMFGGEAGDPKSVRSVLQHQPPQFLVNGYGPTENTTFSVCHDVQELAEDAITVPIGRPISNTQAYILDACLNPVPIGVPGELHLGGDGLARGYWNRPELTAEKFIRNPFASAGSEASPVIYKTGDLARWRPDGTIECLGRIDDQVKLRGFRVELGEIETVLKRHHAIREAVVVLRQTAGGKKLAAYFVPHGRRAPSVSELVRFLGEKLPDYMIPSVFVPLEALPLTPNGKVDRRALPEPGQARPSLEKRLATPRDAVEIKLTEIWENVLNVRPIGIEDKFFELGGHSLLAVRVIAQVEKAFGRKLKLATIFQAPTIEQLAAIIREEIQEGSAIAGTSLVEIQSQGTRPPIYFVHGAGGGMFWGYVNLSRSLGPGQPVYGLKSRGLDGREEFGSIEEMAAQYVADIRVMQPHGPYHLGGYCFGGNVAYEMARQFQAQGEEVALLALLNSAPANSRYMKVSWTPTWALRFIKNLFYWVEYCRHWSPAHRREFVRWKKEAVLRRLRRIFGRRSESPAKVEAGNLVDLSSYSAEQRRLWETHIRALDRFQPRPYEGRVHLFRSPGHPLLCSFEPDYGWGALTRRGVHISIVPGVHEKILEEPCVRVMAEKLADILDENAARTVPQPAPAGAEYWKGQLAGAPALLDVPADRPRPAQLGSEMGRQEIAWEEEFAANLDVLGRASGGTLRGTALAAWQTLLARYTGSEDFVVGTGIDGRWIPVRANLSGSPSFRDVLARVQAALSEGRTHAPESLDRLLADLEVTRNTSYAPLFQAWLQVGEAGPSQAAPGGGPFDLGLRLERTTDGVRGWIEYNSGLFDAARIERMAGHLRALLQGASDDPGRDIWLLPLLTGREARQMLADWNATEKDYPAHLTLSQLFEAQVARTPDATALVAGNERLTYAELNARANQLAHRLRAEGVKPETLVAICVERSWRLIVGILAVLKSGGAYVPMDPAYPRDRLAFILEDTNAPVLLTQKSLNVVQPPEGTRVIHLDAEWETMAAESQENPFSGAEGRHLAYLIYTSGSTGRPKGVALEHRNAVALATWARDVFTPAEIAGVLASTSICFDLSIFEMFVPLSWGGAVILADNALALPSLPAAGEVTMINTVPSAIRELLRLKGVPASVQVVNLAGEPLVTPLVDRIYGETGVRKVYDLYGPSETTTYSTFTLRRAGEPATIGRPLANEQVYLLDRHRQPVPIGVPGEIYIGGAGVARGYLNRPELTTERFVANPFQPGAKLYRTGDLGRWRADGNLEFLGRIDHQVKLRGFRIELGEIESVLRRHPGVRDAVVVVREDQPGDQRLTAYVVKKGEPAAGAGELRPFLKQTLPEYMVPAVFVFLEALPLTPNGKVDRKALPVPEPDRVAGNEALVAPRTETEEQLAAIWRDVLRMKQVGVEDNFFDLGGHSLLAMQVISRAREVFSVELPLSALFDSATIALLAKQIDAGRGAAGEVMTHIEPVSRDGALPVSFVQERLWFLHQLEPQSDAYNMPMAFRLRGKLNLAALQEAMNAVVRRHEALRTTFHYDGALRQKIAAGAPVELPVTTLDSAPDREAALRELADAEAQRPFDLAQGPLLRVRLARLGDSEHVLIVVMHHIISDGWSQAILFEELGAFYNAFAAGKPAPVLPELKLQYADFAAWRRGTMEGPHLAGELDFWKKKLGGAPAAIDLPADRSESEAAPAAAGRRGMQLSKAATEAVQTLSRQTGGSPFITLMAALAVVLEKWTQQSDLVIGTVVAGRNRREMENVIGCFMNFLPIRTQVKPSATVRELMAEMRGTVLEAQAHQDCPFEKIVEAVNPERKQNRNPLYNVALLLQNFPEEALRADGLEACREPVEIRSPLLDLRFEAEQNADGLRLSCDYKAAWFDPSTIDALLASCGSVLEAFARQPEAKVADAVIAEELLAQTRRARERQGEQTLAIAATFTAEPVEESVRYWAKELGMPVRVEFAPYNQVFQELLDPNSRLSTNVRGANVLLVRLEDWLEGGADEVAVERVASEFISAMKMAAARTSTPCLVFFCPASRPALADAARAAALSRMESVIAAELEKLGGVQVLTAAELLGLYPVADYYDEQGDELGKVPYTPLFFAGLGTAILRKFHACLRPAPKVIALDCDNTLWAGVCGEDGPKGIRLDAPRKALQEFMRAQHDAGRLLATCSKNNEEDVREVFAQRLDMPLRSEHFTAWRLNWQPKSENLKSLAAELNLGLDSFVFIDDNPVECAEVEANCPGVTVLQLPDDPEAIPQFLKHCWVFDYLKLTEEDRNRGRMYRENQERQQLLSQSLSLGEFLAGLNLQVDIEPMRAEQLPRVSQLTHRTNQFNCTTVRRSESEMRALMGGADIWTVSVRDRFGDYGLVGVMIAQANGERLEVDTFLLSCRVLGRGVEHRMLARLGQCARERKLKWVDMKFHPSAKNKPALDFLESVGAEFRQPLNGGSVYRFPVDYAVDVVFDPKEDAVPEVKAGAAVIEKPAAGAVAPDRKFTRFRAIALQANDPVKILGAIEGRAAHRAGAGEGYVAPRSEREQQLCALWEKLLRIDGVGVCDNFFELGGHSLLAVRLFAEVEKLTGRKLPLVTIFQAPTVEQLARTLAESDERARSPIVPVRAEGTRPPLFLVHGAGGDVLWGYANLAKYLSADQPVYGIKSRGQVGLEEYETIEEMARYYLQELRSVQPQGPYYLGGYCFGGNVAYEMARQLKARGERVTLLALIDASPANAGYERLCWWRPGYAFRFGRNFYYWFEDFRKMGGAECRRFVARKVRTLARKFLKKLWRANKAEDVDLEEVIDLGHFPEHELRFWQIHLNALVRHVQQPYDGHVTLIRTRGQPLLCSLENDFCWGKLARGGVGIHRIPGSHENIFTEPHVQNLAKELENCLAAARAAADVKSSKSLAYEPA
jgi:amino acid adenylation domain-containing protein/FkbH-like protein